MRARAAAAAAIATALALLVPVIPHAWAAGACEVAFEKWALLSSTRVRPVRDDGAGACLPSESVRRTLLDALARTRGVCGAAADTGIRKTVTLLDINRSFISSLSVCRSEADSAEVGTGWVTEAAPAPKAPAAPKVAVAPPPPKPKPPPAPPPRPVAGGPRPSVIGAPPPMPVDDGPRPAVIAPPAGAPLTGGPRPAVISAPPAPPGPASARPAVASRPALAAVAPPPARAPTPPCLEISKGQGGAFSLLNRRCRGHTVIAVIETRAPSGAIACRGYEIGQSLALRAAGSAAPRVNYECVASQGTCNKNRLGDMFPECDW